MAIPKIVGSQRDFSGGELDESMKRADENPLMKIGARQLSNFRILNSGAAKNRPGRRALFIPNGPRVEEVLMSPGNIFYLVFGAGSLSVYNNVGTRVFTSTLKGDGATAIPWTTATIPNISAVVAAGSVLSIYILYADGAPNNVPQILTWDGVSQTSTWTLTTFAETVEPGGQKRTFFYRISPMNITLLPSATTGNINLTFSANVLVSGMIGTRIRFCNRQILITGVSSGTAGTGTVVEPLPPSQELSVTSQVGTFNIGDEVKGATSGATGIVTSSGGATMAVYFSSAPPWYLHVGATVTGASSGATGIYTGGSAVGGGVVTYYNMTSGLFTASETMESTYGNQANDGEVVGSSNLIVQLIPSATTPGYTPTFAVEIIVGPSGSASISGVTTEVPSAVSVWDNEVMNTYWGYPTSVFYDQGRLGLCNFPSVPSGVGWSAIGLPTDCYVGALADEAIFEIAPGKSQVLFVQPGMESSEFVFCDNAVYYIPIGVSNPLAPGSVAFNQLSSAGCYPNVRPRAAGQSIIFVKSGGTMISAVQTPGAYFRPNVVDDISEYHSHLFTASTPVAIAVQNVPAQFEETYLYVLLANGSLVMSKFTMREGLLNPGPDGKPKMGWLPWSGAGTCSWVSAQSADLVFTTSYAPNGITPVIVAEVQDNTQYLDGQLSVNSLPAPFTPPGGKGPLYNFPGPGGSVTLIDLGTRFMDTYQIDANGNIIPQFIDGENLTSSQLVAGQPWTATLEPFVTDAPPGQSMQQRLRKRRTSRIGAYVSNSTGFLFARLFSGPLTASSPALGTIMNTYRVETWNQGDNPAAAAPLREQAYWWRPLGRDYDPRRAIIKDTPGPLLCHEIDIESTV
jgi:hypothetical protein